MYIRLKAVYSIFVVLWLGLLASCNQAEKNSYSFYHWKSKAENVFSDEGLKVSEIHKIYMHYFDVNQVNTSDRWDDGIYPVYPLTQVDSVYKSCEIVPVVFIVNKVLINTDVKKLAAKIQSLVDEISVHHFGQKINELQIDCDWSASTRYNFFELLSLLKQHYQLSCTIRLHQVKYKSETGLPPVDNGVLMLYNVGDLSDFSSNSILTHNVVAQYINENTDYPIPLDVALPLFSQTVLKNKYDEIKLIKGTNTKLFINDKAHFESLNSNLYKVVQDTLYKGFYLSVDDQIKVEESKPEEIINSFRQIKKSNINWGEVIFYHLDSSFINRSSFNEIIKQL